MSFSVNTNVGAMIALQNLDATSRNLSIVQSRISTGLKVSGAKDNGAIYAIAQNMRADVAGLNAVKQSLSNGVSITDVAVAAGEAVSDLLIEMKEKALAATDASLDTASRNALNADFTALVGQITNIVDNAEFNGTNLISNGASNLSVLSNDSGSTTNGTITVTAQDLSITSGLGVATAGLTTVAAAQSALADVESAITTVNSGLAALGTGAKKLEVHDVFVGKLRDTLRAGIGNLVDADLASESAALQSLQIKQQLGVQALSIANAGPGSILGLFR